MAVIYKKKRLIIYRVLRNNGNDSLKKKKIILFKKKSKIITARIQKITDSSTFIQASIVDIHLNKLHYLKNYSYGFTIKIG